MGTRYPSVSEVVLESAFGTSDAQLRQLRSRVCSRRNVSHEIGPSACFKFGYGADCWEAGSSSLNVSITFVSDFVSANTGISPSISVSLCMSV